MFIHRLWKDCEPRREWGGLWKGHGMIVVRVVVAVIGTLVVGFTLSSALQSVVVPRAGVSRLTWFHFVWIQRVFNHIANPGRPFLERDRILAVYAPFALVTLPAAWVT